MQKMYLILSLSFEKFQQSILRNRRFLFKHVSLLTVLTVIAQFAIGAIINVPADHTTIQAAVDAAAEGDEIIVADGVYNETVNLGNTTAANLTIRAASQGGATVNGQVDASAFHTEDYTGNLTIDGFVVTSPATAATTGVVRAINHNGRLTVENCLFSLGMTQMTTAGIHVNNTITPTQATLLNNVFGPFDNDDFIDIETSGNQPVDILVDGNTNKIDGVYQVIEDDAMVIDVESNNTTAVVVITNNDFGGWTGSGDGLDLIIGGRDQMDLKARVLVEGNTFVGPHGGSGVLIDWNGINTEIDGVVKDNVVTGDPFTGTSADMDEGLHFDNESGAVNISTTFYITGNTISNVTDGGIYFRLFNSNPGDPDTHLWVIDNNSIDNSQTAADEGAIWVHTSSSGGNYQAEFEITNNAITNLAPGSNCIRIEEQVGATIEYLLENNMGEGCSTPSIEGEPTTAPDPVPAENALGSIGNFVWNDMNENGIQDEGEPGIAGIEIEFTDGTFSGSTSTNAQGGYSVPALPAGDYRLRIVPSDAFPFLTTANEGANDELDSDFDQMTREVSVTLAAGQINNSIDAGLSAEEVVECPIITGLVQKTDPDCPGGDGGTILFSSAGGGTEPYMYSIDGGATYQASETFTGLTAGVYTARIKDANDCESETASITIGEGVDDEPPMAVCKDITVTLDEDGSVFVDPFDVDGGSTDNCQLASNNLSQAIFTCDHLGVNEVTLTVGDAVSNTATCMANITVEENPNSPCESEGIAPITDVFVAFLSDSAEVFAQAIDPDGDGPLGFEVLDDFELEPNTEYLGVVVALNIVGEDTIDVTDQIFEIAGNDYITYYGWTEGMFIDPEGDGNIDNPIDPVNYIDVDDNFLPIGFITGWVTGEALSGAFRVVLKDQTGIKSDFSTVDDGETIFDLTFNLSTVTNIIPYAESKQAFNVWPNPAQGKFQWEITQATEPIEEIVIFDKIGRQVAKVAQPSTSIDINELPAGTYSVFANSKNKRWVQRLVITK